MPGFLKKSVTGIAVLWCCLVFSAIVRGQVPDLTVHNGDVVGPIKLPGSNCGYSWMSDQPIGLSPSKGLNIPSFIATNTGANTVTTTITIKPAIISAPQLTAHVINQNTGKVWRLDETGNAGDAVAAGIQLYGIDAYDRYQYVTDRSSGTVAVLNVPFSNTNLIATIDLGKDSKPQGIVANADKTRAYVAESGTGKLAVVDLTNSTLLTTIDLKTDSPCGVAISPDGTTVYVSSTGSNQISVVSIAANKVVGTMQTSSAPQGIALGPDGKKLYVTQQGDNSVAVFNTADNSKITTIKVGSKPFAIAVNYDGSRAYVANNGSNNVSVIDAAANTIITSIPVGTGPSGISASPDGTRVFETNFDSNDVYVIQTSDNTVKNHFASDNLDGHNPFGLGNFVSGPPPVSGCATPFTFTITVSPTLPTVTAAGNLPQFTTSQGVASATANFNVSGLSLREGILVTAPNGYEISADGNTFTPALTIGTGGNIPPTPVYVRLAAAASKGNYSGNIILSSQGAANASEPVTGIVDDPRPVVFAGKVTGKVKACAGAPSTAANIAQITVSAVALNGVFNATAPAGFEISLSLNGGFARHIDISNNTDVPNTTLFIRAVAGNAGALSGNVAIASPGATTVNVPVSGSVYPNPLVDPVNSQTVVSGGYTKTVHFTGTGNTYNWFNDNTSIGLKASGTGDIVSFKTINSGPSPVVAKITAVPVSTQLAYITNLAANTLSVINIATNELIAKVNTGSAPRGLLMSADATRIYTCNYVSNDISVINTGNNKVVATIKVGHSPLTMEFSADEKQLLVYNADDLTVSTIDISTNTVVAVSRVGTFPPGTVFTNDGKYGFVWDGGSFTFSVIEAATGKIATSIGANTRASSIAISPDGGTVYTVDGTNNQLLAVSAKTFKVVYAVNVGDAPQGVTVSPDGSTVYIANGESNTISCVDVPTRKVTNTLPTDHFPFAAVTTAGTGCSGEPAIFTITVTPPVPVITIDGTLPDMETLYSLPSDAATFTVSGANLEEAITLDAPKGYELSLDGTSYSINLTIGTGGDVQPTTVYVRLAAGVPAGTYQGNIVLSSLDAASVSEPTGKGVIDPPKQTIIVGTVTGVIVACEGNPSASPYVEQFIVSGALLTDNIQITAPPNFEISLQASAGYGSSLTLPRTGDKVPATIIYIRSAAGAKGKLTGNVTVSSLGAIPRTPAVDGLVNPVPKVDPVASQEVRDGDLIAAVNFTGTGNTYSWVNDTPGIGLAASGSSAIAPFAAINKGNSPITATVTVTPASAPLAYLPLYNNNSVAVVNTADNSIVGNIKVGTSPFATAVSPDGSHAYIANQGSNTISVINTTSGQLTGTITVGSNPSGVAASRDGNWLYVTNGNSNTVSAINISSTPVVYTINVGIDPEGLVITPDGKWVYVVNRNSNNVTVIDAVSRSSWGTLPVNKSPSGIAITPDGSTIYVSNYNSKNVSIIHTDTKTVDALIIGVDTNPRGLTVSPDGSLLYVANAGANTVSIISTTSNIVTGSFIVGKNPLGVSVSADGKTVYIANYNASSLSVYDVASGKVTTTLPLPGTPVGLGSFIAAGSGCTGEPVKFKIIVDPSSGSLTLSGSLNAMSTVYGTPSVAQHFNVSGLSLTGAVSITPPLGFEVSADAKTYKTTATVGAAGTFPALPVYVRLAQTTVAGNYSGDIRLSVSGGGSSAEPIPVSTVNPATLIIKADNKTKLAGDANPALTASYSGFVNNEGASHLTTPPFLTTTADVSSVPGKYAITVSGAAAANYTFAYEPGVLTVNAKAAVLVIPNSFTPNGDGINDTWQIKNLDTYPKNSVQIFNRFGQSIFFSNGYAVAWDGTYNGVNLATGTYYYMIDTGGAKPISGSITIIR